MDTENKKCPVCGGELSEETSAFIITGKGKNIEVCELCQDLFKKPKYSDHSQNKTADWVEKLKVFTRRMLYALLIISGFVCGCLFTLLLSGTEDFFITLIMTIFLLIVPFISVFSINILLRSFGNLAEDVSSVCNNTQNNTKK